MVVIHIKNGGEQDSFLYETTCDTTNDALIRALVEINNKRLQVAYLCGQARELGKYGPAKKPKILSQVNAGEWVRYSLKNKC